jgi:uncharacterized protein (DUF169 family)
MTPKEMTAKFREAMCTTDSPVAVIYRDEPAEGAWMPPGDGREQHVCTLAGLQAVARQGRWSCFDKEHTGCPGGARFLGLSTSMRPGMEYFLSSGIPGKMEGERYKKTPELAAAFIRQTEFAPVTTKYCIFAPLDQLETFDGVEVIAFLVTPDQLSFLFTLANFGAEDQNGVICPFTAGCGTFVGEPRRQGYSDDPKGVIGMFDPSARPCVPPSALSFSGPTKLIMRMAEDIDESFVITETWHKVQARLRRSEAG